LKIYFYKKLFFSTQKFSRDLLKHFDFVQCRTIEHTEQWTFVGILTTSKLFYINTVLRVLKSYKKLGFELLILAAWWFSISDDNILHGTWANLSRHLTCMDHGCILHNDKISLCYHIVYYRCCCACVQCYTNPKYSW